MSANSPSDPIDAARSQHLAAIRTLGRQLDDIERVRIMNGNRIGALKREFGASLPALDLIQEHQVAVEHEAELELIRLWRRDSLAPWAEGYKGLGEKSIARLVAIVGVPHLGSLGHWEAEEENGRKRRLWVVDSYYERTVSQLWAFCGHGDPARIPLHQKMTQEELMARGNPQAKKQVWKISTGLLKAGVRTSAETGEKYALTPSGEIYLAQREKYREALHEKACVRCGPAGQPALPGSSLSEAHKHARALRYLGKAFLKDLWIASRQAVDENQNLNAGGLA